MIQLHGARQKKQAEFQDKPLECQWYHYLRFFSKFLKQFQSQSGIMPNREGSAQWWHLHQNGGGGAKGVREKFCMQKYIFAIFMLKLSSKFRGAKGQEKKIACKNIFLPFLCWNCQMWLKYLGVNWGGGEGKKIFVEKMSLCIRPPDKCLRMVHWHYLEWNLLKITHFSRQPFCW